MQFSKLASLLASGVNLKTSLAELGFRSVPHELSQAIALGAPLENLLNSLGRQQENSRLSQAELVQALAVPRATRQLLLWLPVLTLFLTVLVGIISFDALFNPLVLLSLVMGSGVLLMGNRITSGMIASVSREFDVADLQDFAVALAAGLNLAQIERRFPQLKANPKISELTELSKKTGARLLSLVNAEIEISLSTQLSEKISQLRKLSVRLLIPLGLTTLPAFMLFIIPPTLVGLIK